MEIFNNTIVYILAPANVHTGGPELLHQMASCLRRRTIDARMCYVSPDAHDPVDEMYKKYHIPYVRWVEDAPENIVIIPEANTEGMDQLTKIRRIVWWLSVDNYVRNIYRIMGRYFKGNSFLSAKAPSFFYFQTDPTLVHWVQSEYARQFIEKNGVAAEQIHFVGDYLSRGFLQKKYDVAAADRERWIAYNPSKGYEFTSRLIQSAPDLQWIPIKDMTPDEVQALLSLARVYIDFGNHPGRDRIPREAAISGCCVVTSKRGSAANAIDVPIPMEFKFEDTKENIPAILQKIRFLLEHYETEQQKFEDYRRKIAAEPQKFEEDVDRVLQYEQVHAAKAALLCPEGVAYGETFFRALREMEGYLLVFSVVENEAEIHSFSDELTCISMPDAAFLYQEKRIDKIMIGEQLLQGEDGERILRLVDSMQIRREDCLLVNAVMQ